MAANPIASRARILFCWVLLFPQFLAPQMSQPLGKLLITSTTPNMSIIINKVPRKEVTPVTLVVFPGRYDVKIGKCPNESVNVLAGQTARVDCPM